MNEATLVSYLKMVLARKWLVLLVVVLIVSATFLVAKSLTPIYRASTTVLIESTKPHVTSIDQLYAAGAASREFFQTQAEFLKSRDVAARVVHDLKLADPAAFADIDASEAASPLPGYVEYLQNLWSSWTSSIAPDSPPAKDVAGSAAAHGPDARERRAIRRLQAGLNVELIRLSQLVRVSYESPDPTLAAAVANGVADAYIRADLDARFEVTKKARIWLGERLEELRLRLEASERALQAARDEAGIINGPGVAMGGNARQIDSASERLVQARITRSQIEEVYRQVRKGAPNRYLVPQVFNNPAVAKARDAQTQAEREFQEVAQRLGSSHPLFLKAAAELKVAAQNYINQAEDAIASISKEYEVARSTELAIQMQIESTKSSIQDLTRKELQLDTQVREVNTNRQLYQTFLERVRETSATSDFQSPIGRVIDPAVEPAVPVRPATSQLCLLAALFGVLFGSALAIYLERSSKTIKSTDDVEEKLNLPLLAAIPIATEEALEGSRWLDPSKTDHLYLEAIRTAVTGVKLSTIDVQHPAIAFISSVPGEGKSTLAIQFAIEVARTQKVLLIDADLRRPVLGSRLRVQQNRPGLTELVAGSHGLADCLLPVPHLNLWFVGGGARRANPLDLFLTPAFQSVVNELAAHFEMVIVDTPPVELVSDALLIGRACTAAVYIAKANSTPIPTIRRGTERLEAADIRVLGIALNAHDFKRASRYYGESAGHAVYDYPYKAERSPERQHLRHAKT